MRPRLLLALFLVAPTPSSPAVSGITTSNFGSGCGIAMHLSFNAAKNALHVHLIGSSPLDFSFVLEGVNELHQPIDFPSPPFGAGCQLLIRPYATHPLKNGTSGTLHVPPVPGLVGMTIKLQGISLSLMIPPGATQPIVHLSQGVSLTFH